nr:hypothetical protein [Acidobacteriota bacterium]
MTMRLAAGVLAGILAVLAPCCAPVLAEPTRPLVSLPVFVTDARGHSIRNLGLPDIEIAEGGTPQKIASVTFREAASRRVAIFLDEYHVSPGASTARAREALTAFAVRHL